MKRNRDDLTDENDPADASKMQSFEVNITGLPKKYIDVLNRFQDAPVIPVGILLSAICGIPAERELATEQYQYRMSEQQHTLFPATDSTDHTKYQGALSEAGETLLNNIIVRVSEGKFDSILHNYCITSSHSGPNIPDRSSPYYAGEMIALNSFDNKIIRGFTGNNYINCGYIVMYTNEWAWSSDSVLYKLEQQCDVSRFAHCEF